MDGVRHFMKLDWLAFKPYRKYFLMLTVSVAYIFGDNGHAYAYSVIFCIVIAGMLPPYLFAGEDKSGMTRLYAALPINKKEVVIGRYFGGAAVGLICILAAALLMAVDSMASSAFPLQDVINGFGLSTGMFFIMMSFQFPFLFWLGFIKAQVFTMAIPAFSLIAVNLIWSKALTRAVSHLSNSAGLASLGAGVVCLIISLCISIVIYRNKQA